MARRWADPFGDGSVKQLTQASGTIVAGKAVPSRWKPRAAVHCRAAVTSGRTMHNRLAILAGLAIAGALTAAACGGGGDDAQSTPADEAEAADAVEETPSEAAEEPDAAPEAPDDEAEPVAVADPEPEDDAQQTPIADPDREVLVYGESIASSIVELEEVRQFRFEGSEGDLVRISVNGQEGMDPIVTLLEPNRTEIAVDDDSGPGRDALLIATLSSNGLQVVRVEAFLVDIGPFVMSLELLPVEPDTEGPTIKVGETLPGVLGDPEDVDVFEFAGDEGQAVVIRVDGALGVDTRATLFGPGGATLRDNDDSGHGLDAEIALVLPNTGTYRIDVFAVGNRIGPYQLSVVEAPTDSTPPEDVAATIEGTAITFLAAMQNPDPATLRGLAGPELLQIWGWESTDDVALDFGWMFTPAGEVVEVTSTIEGNRARVFIELDPLGDDAQSIVRFDMVSIDGEWLVDHWKDATPLPVASDEG